MEQEQTEISNTKLSKINSAQIENIRRSKLWEKCHELSDAGKLWAWNIQLDNVWLELSGDVISKSVTEKQFERIQRLITKYKKKNSIFYQVLMMKHTFLKRLENAQGKGPAYHQSFDDYLSE